MSVKLCLVFGFFVVVCFLHFYIGVKLPEAVPGAVSQVSFFFF